MSTTILKKDSTYGCTHLSIYPDHPPLLYKIIWELSRTILSQGATICLLTSLIKSYIVVIKAPEVRALIITASGQLQVVK